MGSVSSQYFCIYFFIYASISVLFFVTGIYSDDRSVTDQQALLQFKAGIASDPLGVMSSWNSSTHFCQWYGVTCGRRHQRVTVLNLTSSKLVGPISPYIGNLSFLKELYLQNNSFIHHIPPEIGRLQRLEALALFNNSLTGEIPSNVSRCSNLVRLSFFGNNLIGKVPVELGYLSKLILLSVSINNLTGSLPDSLGNLSSLVTLSAGENKFSGSIPDALGKLKNLTVLGLITNNFSGNIPSSIFNLSSITNLDVGYNKLEGFLPADLFTSLPNLQLMSFAYNQFSGPVPNSLSNASNLVYVQLQGNQLIGNVPSLDRLNVRIFLIHQNLLGIGKVDDLSFLCSLSNSRILQYLDISINNFGGSLPDCIGNLSPTLEYLDVDTNQIYGSIPQSLGNLVNLSYLVVSYNKFSGVIPQSIGNLQNLVVMIFNDNNLSGPIPSTIGNMQKLNRLQLANNNLQGMIPSSLGNCKNLQALNFSGNNLSNTIPPEVMGLSSLSIYADFSNNFFTGSLPTEVGNLKSLGTLDVSNNMLSGEIPTSLGSCTSLERLYMNGNRFQGSIPPSISSLRGLDIVDLSHNNFSGQIPEFFAGFGSLISLNLSFNDFEGGMPIDGVYKNASITSVLGNSKLCGGVSEFRLPVCYSKRSNKRRIKVAIISIGGTSAIIFVVLAFLLLLWFIKNNKKSTSSNPENSLVNLPRVTYNDLHKATNGFSEGNLIGTGSFGSVYKGILIEGKPIVAVKVLKLHHHGATKSFMAECEALRNVRHRNLVKIITACSSVDNQGNDFKALVYDFMVNGSLEEWLHPPAQREGDEDMNLNLIQRINIAIDVASAIEYLHHHSDTPIVHCDLKPSNVLLDDEMSAHISDFGLAKFILPRTQIISTDQLSSVGLRGTIGYAPPEYGVGSEVSMQGDIYSYGILLLEMFTGKRPTDDMFMEGMDLHKFVKSGLPDKVFEILNQTLVQETEQIQSINKENLISIFEIGVACSAEIPEQRMNISNVTKMLSSVRKKLVSSYRI